MKKYELLEHTADIAIKVYGDSIEEVFASAAEAMFELITGTNKIRPGRKIEFQVKSDDLESLLVNFLSQLIAYHEIERLVFGKFEVALKPDFSLKATGWGEEFDSERHSDGAHIKGVSYHMMEIFDGRGLEVSYAIVLFDV